MNNEPDNLISYEISEDDHDTRLDVFLSSRIIEFSRSMIQSLIRRDDVRVNNHSSKPGYKLKAGDHVSISIPPTETYSIEPESVEFGIVYEDNFLIVIDKPAGLVVHPAPGHDSGTLVHGLLKHCGSLSGIGGDLRPGIVHRLDKGTSGLIVVAKDDRCHNLLADQFKAGAVKKKYVALVHGQVKSERGEIDLPVARHVKNRKKMSVSLSSPKRALTLWQKTEEFMGGFALLSVSIKTGRTHQIRVHLSHMGYPIVGDPVYGYGKDWWKQNPVFRKADRPPVERQMLHSMVLGFVHPGHNRYLEFEAPIPDDMKLVLKAMQSL